jgi:hypothetical protein
MTLRADAGRENGSFMLSSKEPLKLTTYMGKEFGFNFRGRFRVTKSSQQWAHREPSALVLTLCKMPHCHGHA